MQQNQSLPVVKDKIPQANSLLPHLSMKSQSAKHIIPKIMDIRATSSIQWPLDENNKNQEQEQHVAKVLDKYYDRKLQIDSLLKQKDDIVYINVLAMHSIQANYKNDLGFISTYHNYNLKETNHKYYSNISELQFDDCIQGGNLYFALKHDQNTYILGSRLDYNTLSYGQWFYFKIRNRISQSGHFKFYLINMTKNGAMFGKGLKISVCRKGVWGKEGTDIAYLPNKFIRNKFKNRHYYTLCFNLKIQAEETIYVAYNEPYTYTKLAKKLDSIKCENMGRSIICRTPLQNRMEILSFTKRNSLINKKVIFIVGRTHPVETAGSFVIEGIIEELSKPNLSPEIQSLLSNYIINIVPMINPDGVILGNSRCNLYGFDLNRQWKNPTMKTAPQIMKLKTYILKYEGRIEMFLDIHGHSKKKNVFAYGCHDFREPYASREFPYLLSKNSEKDFLFSQCRFTRVTEKKSAKEGTARISLWKKLKIPNIFTIENSYCCARDSKYHYDCKEYGEIGKDILNTLVLYFFHKIKRNEQKDEKISEKLNFRQNLLKELRINENNLTIGLGKEDSSESESEQRVDEIQTKEYYKNNFRKKQQKILLRSKTQKVTSMRNPDMNRSKNEQRKEDQYNSAIQRTTTNVQLQNSTSTKEIKFKKVAKTLMPIPKKRQMQIPKCGGGDQRVSSSKDKKQENQFSQLQLKQKASQIDEKTLSIVDIGKQDLEKTRAKNTYSLVQMNFKTPHSPEKRLKQYREMDKKKQQMFKKSLYDKRNNILNHIIPTLKQKKVKPPSNIEQFIRKFNDLKPEHMKKYNQREK